MKSQINIRASALLQKQLDELTEQLGTSITETVSIAIDRMYQQETSTMNTTSNTQSTICPHCGAEYDSAFGNHICEVNELEGLIYNETKFVDESDQEQIAKWQERIAEVKEFWHKHPNFQSSVSKQMPE